MREELDHANPFQQTDLTSNSLDANTQGHMFLTNSLLQQED